MTESQPAVPESEEAKPDEAQATGPYKSLWIPLVIVPAAIVGTILVVFVMFGSIAGEEKDLEANLQTVLHGGANEREQAVFSMVRQLQQNRLAGLRGEEFPWPIGEGFVDDLRSTWEKLPEDDLDARLVVATTLSQLDDEEGVTRLMTLLDATDKQDPDGQLRFHALAHLGASGAPEAQPGLLRYLAHEDAGLRKIAVIGLQNMPGQETLRALYRALEDSDFEVRANAALGLSRLKDSTGASLLLDMLDEETYAAIHRAEEAKFARSESISQSRAAAVLGLGDLQRAEDFAVLEKLAADDEDLLVREAAMRVVSAWNAKSE